MKKIVTYEIRGQVHRSCVFKVGHAVVRIDFTGGTINNAGVVPACYTTDNALYQHAIESSEAYLRGEIKKAAEQCVEEPVTLLLGGENGQEAGEEEMAFSQVTNMQQARMVLMGEPFGVSIVDLQNKAAVKAKAAQLGITFPCWN